MLLPKTKRRKYMKRFNPRRRTRRQMLESAVSGRRRKPCHGFTARDSIRRRTPKNPSRMRLHESYNEFDRPLFEETFYGAGKGFDEADPYEERTGHDGEAYINFDPGTTVRIVSVERGDMEWEYPNGKPEAFDSVAFNNLGDGFAELSPEQVADSEEFVISSIVEMKNLSPGVYTFGGSARLLFDADVNVYADGKRRISGMHIKDSDFSGIRVAMKESNGRLIRNGKLYRWI